MWSGMEVGVPSNGAVNMTLPLFELTVHSDGGSDTEEGRSCALVLSELVKEGEWSGENGGWRIEMHTLEDG